MAIASKGKGKRGGARVITYNLYQEEDVIVIDLLTIYDKNEISNISDDFITYLLNERKKYIIYLYLQFNVSSVVEAYVSFNQSLGSNKFAYVLWIIN